jgi:hypothetical protein
VSVTRDWCRAAAEEIARSVGPEDADPDTFDTIIARHCPFKRGVVYVEAAEPSKKEET